MREALFWTGVLLTVWGPGFTVLFYSYGGEEKRLSAALSALETSPRLISRWWGRSVSFVVGKESRWVMSAGGLVVLLFLKLAAE